MALQTVQQITLAGLGLVTPPPYVACAAGGDTFVNDGRCFVIIRNAAGIAIRTVTIASQVTCKWGEVHDETVAVPVGASEVMFGPFPINRWNNGSNIVSLTYSSEADIEIAVFRLP